MKRNERNVLRGCGVIFSLLAILALSVTSPAAGDYADALKGVKGVKAVYDVSLGAPGVANVIFWAVRNSYEDETVLALPEKPRMAVVFHGPAVRLLTKNASGFPEEAGAEVEKFHETIRQMKKDGVKLEVCMYAAKVMGVNPSDILPEIDQVGNGFISVIGYQAQGYSVVRIP